MRRRIPALLLAAVILFTVIFTPTFSAEALPQHEQSLVEAYSESIEVAAQESSAAVGFYRFLRIMRFMIRAMSGQLIFPDKNFDVRVDAEIENYCRYIAENSDLDIMRILTNLPDTNRPAELTVRAFGIDTVKMREQLNKKSNEYWSKGNYALSGIYMFLANYFSIMETCEVTTAPTDEENVHEVELHLIYRDGGTQILRPGIFINSVTGEAYNRDGSGMIGTGFNCSIYDLLVYAPINAWMRNFGFSLFYDLYCYTSPNWMWNYVTRRFHFDYDGREWMIQIWKGNYLITNGGEIGIYNRDKSRTGTFYDCAKDEDMLEIGMTVRHGDDTILSLPRTLHWWRNGFKMDTTLYDPDSLTLEGEIVMRDEEMLKAFCKAIDRNYRHDVTYTVDGLTVYLTW